MIRMPDWFDGFGECECAENLLEEGECRNCTCSEEALEYMKTKETSIKYLVRDIEALKKANTDLLMRRITDEALKISQIEALKKGLVNDKLDECHHTISRIRHEMYMNNESLTSCISKLSFEIGESLESGRLSALKDVRALDGLGEAAISKYVKDEIYKIETVYAHDMIIAEMKDKTEDVSREGL